MRDLLTVLWQAVKPHTDFVSGLYLVLAMLGGLWALGAILSGVTPKLIGWWERRRGAASLPVWMEVRIILATLVMVWVLLISIILLSDVLLAEEWSLLPLPITPE